MLRTLVKVGIFSLSLLFQEAAAIQLWNNTDSFSDDVPAACQNALTFNVKCANYLVTARDVINGAALVGNLAEQYCTEECHDSIDTFQKNSHLACGNKAYQLFKNTTTRVVPGDIVNGLMWAYDLSCIKDSTGYCLADIYNHTKAACSDCTLKYGAVMASSDYGRKQFPLEVFSSLLSSCSVPASSYPYEYTSSYPTTTSESSSASSTGNATPTPTCAGKTYVAKEDDTCKSISESQSISTDRLAEINHLDYSCSSLTSGTELCIEKTCKVYTVQANQTCEDIVRGKTFGLVQLIGWNPTIHQNCDNLDSMVGRSICISPPGGGEFTIPTTNITTSKGLPSTMFSSWVPGETTTMATSTTTSWYYPIYDPNYTQQPLVGKPNSTWSSLMAERTQYCWLTDYQEESEDFYPDDDLSPDCLSLYESYCDLGPTDPVPKSPVSSIPKTCTPQTSSEEPKPSTTVTPTTTGIVTPTPTQTGMAKDCNKFHKVAKDEGCQKISDDSKASLNDFLAWNPDVGKDCKSLKYDYYVCVGKKSTSAPVPTTTGIVTPTPIQTGMAKGCRKFHKVAKDEGCQQIADDSKVSLKDFLAWNPDVGNDCKKLKYDFHVCVGK
ncbi:hypothetical protein N7517_004791 [Penicillium concentricum]|uniref:LysM domain-containing protein n=1 Tax=Penicillium concentricum TaxID=293559 RepID=A0A9W9S6H9_9EURO|nr:uncharacterized protein N7517_004791 [Penicillium concentricum]KAJ5372785.1 hypothetical protein N7517_004791 [Penicillium concentricum]